MTHCIFENTIAACRWPDIQRLGQGHAVALLPTDPLEEHGPTMPVCVDVLFSYVLAQHVAELLDDRNRKAIVSPPVYWGIANATAAYPGTFSLRKDTLKQLVLWRKPRYLTGLPWPILNQSGRVSSKKLRNSAHSSGSTGPASRALLAVT